MGEMMGTMATIIMDLMIIMIMHMTMIMRIRRSVIMMRDPWDLMK